MEVVIFLFGFLIFFLSLPFLLVLLTKMENKKFKYRKILGRFLEDSEKDLDSFVNANGSPISDKLESLVNAGLMRLDSVDYALLFLRSAHFISLTSFILSFSVNLFSLSSQTEPNVFESAWLTISFLLLAAFLFYLHKKALLATTVNLHAALILGVICNAWFFSIVGFDKNAMMATVFILGVVICIKINRLTYQSKGNAKN